MVVTGGTTAAHADTRCSWGSTWINGGAGAEAPRMARGHYHKTGNHYIRSSEWDPHFGKYIWQWYADHNGGNDGDDWDSYYGESYCNNALW
nr:hypothetical protein [Streptosporangium canum]